jgi:RHS repeat-associated protein
LLPARSPLSPRTHWRKRLRVRRRTSGRSFAYNLRFPGQIFGGPAGLHANGFSDFDPATGKYWQSDPIGLRGGINTYVYVEGNPISEIDPSGLMGSGGGGSAGHPSSTPIGCDKCQGNDRWTVEITSTPCATGDAICGLAMEHGGIPGPYYPHTRTFSKSCLVTMGMIAKPVGFAASDLAVRNAPKVATKFGVSEGMAAAFGRGLSRVLGWEAALFLAPLTIDEVANTCECKK